MIHACYFTNLEGLVSRKLGTVASRCPLISKSLFKRASRQMLMESGRKSDSRGALIVLEGLDRSGKTSQSSRLISYLEGLGHSVESWRFPDRNTGVGQMISSYLTNKSHLDDNAIHLLFSANRWEKRFVQNLMHRIAFGRIQGLIRSPYQISFMVSRSLIETMLRNGTTLIVDRYSFSGVAFSSAKGLDIEWCKAPEMGLLAPDLVLYLDISPEKAVERGGYGGERYEQLEFQRKVAHFYKILSDASWKTVDACLPIEDVEKELREMVLDCVTTCQNGKPLSKLWENSKV